MKMLRLARYPRSAHEIIRLYPEKFTSTILLTKFVSKSWLDDQALLSALEDFALQERKRPLRAMITDHEVKEIESRFADRGVKATSKGSKQSGQITLVWSSLEEFNELEGIFSREESNRLPSSDDQQRDRLPSPSAESDGQQGNRLPSSELEPGEQLGNRLPSQDAGNDGPHHDQM